MSSLTKDEYIDELQLRSSILAGMDDITMSIFVDGALRAYSSKLPKVKWDINNTVVADQELYDFPSSAIRIISVRTTSGRYPIGFAIEDQGSGNQIRIGNIESHSYEGLLKADFYLDPLNYAAVETAVSVDTIVTGDVGYDAFDTEYVALQTIPEISDSGLETIALYIEYLGLNSKADEIVLAMADDSGDIPAAITDSDSSGASTSIQFDSQSKKVEQLRKMAKEKLDEFNDEISHIPFGMRG